MITEEVKFPRVFDCGIKFPEYKFPPKEYKTGKQDIILPFNWALGQTWTRFFDGLKEEKIFGTKCKKCNKLLVPARSFCPGCYKDMEEEEWVEVAQEGTVDTWCLVNYTYYNQIKEPPYIIAQIQLDNTDCSITHFIGGFDLSDPDTVSKKMESVARVKTVWSKKKNADIYDIAYFEPIG